MKHNWILWAIVGAQALEILRKTLLPVYNGETTAQGRITTKEKLLLSQSQAEDEASTAFLVSSNAGYNNDDDSRSKHNSSSPMITTTATNKGFHFNTMVYLYGQNGDGTGRTANDPNVTKIGIRYQCEGAEYERFSSLLRRRAKALVRQGARPLQWGRRVAPLPPHARVLIFGNSHARQVALALAGQGGAEMITEVHAYGFDQLLPSQIMAQRYRYTNNSTLYIVANSVVAHCPHPNWKVALEQQIEASLDSMDAIVMGVFNPGRILKKHIKTMMPAHLGCSLTAPRPTVANLAQLYPGPIAFISMFGLGSHLEEVKYSHQVLNKLRRRYNRTTVAIESRDYVKILQHEGSHKEVDDVTTTTSNTTTSGYVNQTAPGICVGGGKGRHREGMGSHRCVGPQGGMPDMVAWDLSEFVYHVMQEAR